MAARISRIRLRLRPRISPNRHFPAPPAAASADPFVDDVGDGNADSISENLNFVDESEWCPATSSSKPLAKRNPVSDKKFEETFGVHPACEDQRAFLARTVPISGLRRLVIGWANAAREFSDERRTCKPKNVKASDADLQESKLISKESETGERSAIFRTFADQEDNFDEDGFVPLSISPPAEVWRIVDETSDEQTASEPKFRLKFAIKLRKFVIKLSLISTQSLLVLIFIIRLQGDCQLQTGRLFQMHGIMKRGNLFGTRILQTTVFLRAQTNCCLKLADKKKMLEVV